jgi:hypothetical protein
MTERRKNRSDVPHEAVALYLAAATRGTGVRAVALAGEEGALLGGAGGGEHLELLAALGASCAGREAHDDRLAGLVDAFSEGDDFYASRLPVGERTLYLASLGARVPRQKALAAHLGRILAPGLSP